MTVEGAESPRAEEQRVGDVTKKQLIIQEEEEGDEKKDEEKAVPSDEQPPEVSIDCNFLSPDEVVNSNGSLKLTPNLSLGIYFCLGK